MDSVGFAEFEQPFLREVWIELDLIDNGMDPRSG